MSTNQYEKKLYSALKEMNSVIDRTIKYFKWIATIGGMALIVMSYVIQGNDADKYIGWKISAQVLSTIGSSFFSIGLISISYEQWQKKKENLKAEKYFLMGSSFVGYGEELQEIANIDKDSGKILLIGEMDKTLKAEYGYTTLLGEKYIHLLLKNKPLLSYGTSFDFLGKNDYYTTIKTALKKGYGLCVSILYPDSKISDNDNIDQIVISSQNTVRIFSRLISEYTTDNSKNIGQIELRLTRYFSPCSFSSVEFLNGRTIRTLEFNFMHEGQSGIKKSQVYDNNSKTTPHGEFSQYLFNRYERLYKESILALKYPMNNEITYYVLGVIVDVHDKSKNQIKEAIYDKENNFIKIVTSVH